MIVKPPATLVDRACRVALWIAWRMMRMWWFVRRPHHDGALVAIWVDQRILLVRQSYRRAWSFPGGGVAAGETPAEAARRELNEELGIDAGPVLDAPAFQACGRWHHRRDHVRVFEWHLPRCPDLHLDRREITEARLVSRDTAAMLRLTAPVRAYLGQASTG